MNVAAEFEYLYDGLNRFMVRMDHKLDELHRQRQRDRRILLGTVRCFRATQSAATRDIGRRALYVLAGAGVGLTLAKGEPMYRAILRAFGALLGI